MALLNQLLWVVPDTAPRDVHVHVVRDARIATLQALQSPDGLARPNAGAYFNSRLHVKLTNREAVRRFDSHISEGEIIAVRVAQLRDLSARDRNYVLAGSP